MRKTGFGIAFAMVMEMAVVIAVVVACEHGRKARRCGDWDLGSPHLCGHQCTSVANWAGGQLPAHTALGDGDPPPTSGIPHTANSLLLFIFLFSFQLTLLGYAIAYNFVNYVPAVTQSD